MKILLVDDETEFVSALAERLLMRGIEADWVSEPEKAIEKLKEQSYELAVLDVKMPKLGGISLKRRLQELCPGLKFIFLTGHGSEESFKEGAAEAGADYYLLKPVHLEDLLRKIKDALSNQ